jgi:hypothetical protein
MSYPALVLNNLGKAQTFTISNSACCGHNLCPSISSCKVPLGLSCSFNASELLCIIAVSGDIVCCGYYLKHLLVSLPQLIEGAIEIFGNGRNRFSYDFLSDLATLPLYLHYCGEKTIGYHSIAHVRCVALYYSPMRWTDTESIGHIRSDIQYLF